MCCSEFSLWQIYYSRVGGLTVNSIQAEVFQMSTMVILGIGFQEPLTRPSVKLDEKMSICSSTSQDQGGSTNSSWLERVERDLKVRKCRAMLFLRTSMSRKWT